VTPANPRAARALRRLGTKLADRYTLVRLLGMGGMATVYEATDRTGPSVALKLLHESLSGDPDVERLFRREARLANTIAHAGVIPVVDHGVSDDGCVFLAMPLLRGETLNTRAARAGGTLPPEEVFVIGHAVLEALAAAHAGKIVHRDLKPSNIFVTRDGAVKVLDFGIARFFDIEGAATATASGVVLGTPAFMAPEQALGRAREVDGRSDLWGLGATLFTLLSGRYVHDGVGAGELAVLAATKPARRLADVAPGVPHALCDVIDRALSFERSARWPDAAAMDAALLAACRAAFGKRVSELAKLAVPVGEEPDTTLGGVPTKAPEDLAPASGPRDGSGQAFAVTDRNAAKPARRRLALTIAATALAAAAAVPVVRGRMTNASAIERTSAKASAAADELTGPGNAPVAGDALAEYRAGIQLWRDASVEGAAEKLAAATTKEPAFAAAHLWFVLATGYATAASRAHYASAVTYRSALTGTQAALLEALRPAMDDPPDYATTGKQMESLAARYPEIRAAQARLLQRTTDLHAVEASLAALPADANTLGIVLLTRAGVAGHASDTAEELRLLDECVQRSPTATRCLSLLWQLDAAEGRCDALEPVCRKLTARAPSSPAGYQCLADALISTGSPTAEASAAYDEAYRRMSPADVPLARAQNDVWLAVAAGRLDRAAERAKAWVDLGATADAPPVERASAYEAYVALSLEIGQRDAAVRAARELFTLGRSWPRTSNIDLGATGIFLRSEAGDLGAAERGPLRARVIAATEEPSYGNALRRWYNGYAATSWTHDEATEAVAHVPVPLQPSWSSDDDYLFARVFALAGDDERATPLFTRAAHSCSVHDDFYRTKAKLELAARPETQPEEACALSADVASHWGTSKSVTAAAAEARARAHHCTGGAPAAPLVAIHATP